MSTSQFLSCSIPLLPSPKTFPFSFLIHPGATRNISDNHHKGTQHTNFLLLLLRASAGPALPNPTSPAANRRRPPASPPANAFRSPAPQSTTSTQDDTTVEALIQTLRGLPATSQRFQAVIKKIESDGGFHTIDVFNDLLTGLVTEDEFELALKLSSNLSSYGFVPDVRTHSILVTCYCSQDDPFSARRVLDRMVLEMGLQPNVATFTTLINAFCENGRVQRAFEVFEMMNRIGCEPTINTYNCLLKGLCYVGRVEEAYDLFTKIKTSNKKPDVYSYTALMNGFCKVGRSDEALELLDEALKMGLKPNAVTFNTLINGFFKEGRPLDGVDLLKRMQEGHCSPDYISYNTLLHGLLKWGEVWAALDVYKQMVVIGFGVDERLMNALLRGLCRLSRKEDCLLKDIYDLFGRMRHAGYAISHPACDMVIEAFCSGGREVPKALECLLEMIRRGNPPKSITLRHVVRALCWEGKIEEAVSIVDLMSLDDRMPVNYSFGVLIDEMNRCGMLVSSWNVYGAAIIKRGVVPRRNLGDRPS